MKKFEEIAQGELTNANIIYEAYPIDYKEGIPEGGLVLTNRNCIYRFPWLEFGKDWVSPEDHQAEIEKLKSQLDKQQLEIPEVPPFVADWYEENKGSLDYMIFETCRDLTDESTDEFENWFGYDENKAITTLVHMKNGYTVKEKRFYLKNKLTKKFLAVRIGHEVERVKIGDYQEVRNLSLENKGLFKVAFTQQEIDSMAAESYEQIKAEDE